MHGEKGKHKGMMYVAGGVIMVAMMATFMFLTQLEISQDVLVL